MTSPFAPLTALPPTATSRQVHQFNSFLSNTLVQIRIVPYHTYSLFTQLPEWFLKTTAVLLTSPLMIFPMTPPSFRIKCQLLSTAHNVSLIGRGYFSSLVLPYALASSPPALYPCGLSCWNISTTFLPPVTHLSCLVHSQSASPLRQLSLEEPFLPPTCSYSSLLPCCPPYWIIITFLLFF